MIGKLVVGGTKIDLTEGIPFPLNYSIADVKEPQKRKRNFSKEIVLEGTQKNLDFFSSTYQLGLSTVGNTTSIGFNYDPTIRIPAKYYNGGLLIFNGLFRLNEVSIIDGNYSFKCTLFSNFIDLFMKLGDLKLGELDWSEYTHTLNRTNVINSFDTSVIVNGTPTSNFTGAVPDGFGYCYGMIDYGYTAFSTKDTTDIVPLIYAKEAVEKCLAVAGMTYSSAYFDSDLFKKIMIGFGGGEKISVPASEVVNRRVNWTEDINNVEQITYISSTPISGSSNHFRFLKNKWISLIDESFGVTPTLISDNFDQYYLDHTDVGQGTDGRITIAKKGFYNLSVSQDITTSLTIGAMVLQQGVFNTNWILLKNGVEILSLPVQSAEGFGTDSIAVNQGLQLDVGDILEIRYNVYIDATYKFLAPITITIDDANTTVIDLTCIQATLQDGDDVEIARFIPEMKASEFMEGIITMGNLALSDPDIFDVVTIEPLEEFYLPSTDFWDITQIVDHSREIKIKPASTIEGKIYKFKWDEDKDFDSLEYRSFFQIGYGDHWHTVPSTFQTGERVYKVPFAQTIPTDAIYPFVAPRIISVDSSSGVIKPFKGKPRIYLYNGMKAGKWRLKDTNGNGKDDLTEYPSMHHFDDWENPAFDLNFGLPILFDYNAPSVTTDNLFTRYHERFIKEITGRDSKIVELYAKLSNNDINRLNFAKSIMWNGVLFRLNLIQDFDPNVTDSTKIELVKILEAKNKRTGFEERVDSNQIKTILKKESPSGIGADVGVIWGGIQEKLNNSFVIRG